MAITSNEMLSQIREAMAGLDKPDRRTLFIGDDFARDLLRRRDDNVSYASGTISIPRLAGYPVRTSPLVPPGMAMLVDLTPLRFDTKMEIDWRPSWQRGSHPRPQTDDMRQMLEDLAAEGWRK